MSDLTNSHAIGRVVGLWRYPVKSMGPEALSEAQISWHGIAGDRRWAFIRDDAIGSGFPWLTLRQRPDMSQYSPSFTRREKPEKSPAVVRTPSGDEFDVADPTLASELYPKGAKAIKQSCGAFDTFPLSLTTTQTLAKLGEMVSAPLDVQRFRPNILIEADDDTPFAEDSWVGCVLRIGQTRMRVDTRDSRCVVITIDPTTAEKNPAVLRAVAGERQGCLGVYGTTVAPGSVALGDVVLMAVPT